MFKQDITCKALLTALMMVAVACSSSSTDSEGTPTAEAAAEELPKVEVEAVSVQSVPQVGEYTATVEAFKTNNISSSTPNRIKNILVDVGSRVARGQKLVELDNVNIDQLKVRLDNSEREYNRAVQLLEIGAGTQQSVDQLKTELDAARRNYTNMLENTVLTSPIAGVVTARNYDPGDMTGQLPILTIEQINPVKVVVNITEADFSKVRKGMSVDITLDTYPGETFRGSVYLIHPTVNPQTRTFTVEITINNPGDKVLPGMFARVLIPYGVAEHVVVPDRAVVKMSGSGNKYVYVYKDGRVSYNQVELGRRMDTAYELLSGVTDGSMVVISGQSRLADGVKVDVINRNSTDSVTTTPNTAAK